MRSREPIQPKTGHSPGIPETLIVDHQFFALP